MPWLLLGPLYHLPARADRLRALSEAARVVKPGGPVFAAAISRWAPRLHGERGRAVVMAAARELGRIPELLGIGPHLLATARRPDQRS